MGLDWKLMPPPDWSWPPPLVEAVGEHCDTGRGEMLQDEIARQGVLRFLQLVSAGGGAHEVRVDAGQLQRIEESRRCGVVLVRADGAHAFCATPVAAGDQRALKARAAARAQSSAPKCCHSGSMSQRYS